MEFLPDRLYLPSHVPPPPPERHLSDLAHFATFWLAGLLTGVLLGWTLGRGIVSRARQRSGERESGQR